MKKSKLNISNIGKKTILPVAASLVLQSVAAEPFLSFNNKNKMVYETINTYCDYNYNHIWDTKLTALELHTYNKKEDNLIHILNRKERQTKALSTAYTTYRDSYFQKNFKPYTDKYTAETFLDNFKDKAITEEFNNDYSNLCFYSFIGQAFTDLNSIRHGQKAENEFEWTKGNKHKAIKNTTKTATALTDIEHKIISFYGQDQHKATTLRAEFTKLKQILTNKEQTKNSVLIQLHEQIEVIVEKLGDKNVPLDMLRGLVSEYASQYQANMTLATLGNLKTFSETTEIEDTRSK